MRARRALIWAFLFGLCSCRAGAPASAPGPSFGFTVVHTNDLHSHFEGSGPDAYFTPAVGDGDPVLGHYARLASAIAKIRAECASSGKPVLVVDSGDFFGGSLFDFLAPDPGLAENPELDFFRAAQFDATTLGNHEFDPGDDGLATVLSKARASGFLSHIVASNIRLREGAPEVYGELPRSILKTLRQNGRELRVGILGVMGLDAAKVSATSRKSVSFFGFDDAASRTDPGEWQKQVAAAVGDLRQKQRADAVIVLLHGGHPEDLELARAVKGIDLIVAGHTHELYSHPIRVGKTWIVQAGAYGQDLGRLELSWNGSELGLGNPEDAIQPIDDGVASDPSVLARIARYKALISARIRSTGYDYATPVAKVDRDWIRTRASDDAYGKRVTSALREEVNKRIAPPVDLYVTGLSLIREDMRRVGGQATTYQFSDVFRILSIGFDEKLRPGSPVVAFYVAKDELWWLIQFLEFYREISRRFTVAYSDSLQFKPNAYGIPFVNKLGDLRLNGKAYEGWPALVRVATSRYIANYLGLIRGLSHGLVRVQMRDASGAPVDKPETLDVPREAVLFADYLKTHCGNGCR